LVGDDQIVHVASLLQRGAPRGSAPWSSGLGLARVGVMSRAHRAEESSMLT
jgi:hypothetical protein